MAPSSRHPTRYELDQGHFEHIYFHELDLDDAVVHYDVDFRQGGKDYEWGVPQISGRCARASRGGFAPGTPKEYWTYFEAGAGRRRPGGRAERLAICGTVH